MLKFNIFGEKDCKNNTKADDTSPYVFYIDTKADDTSESPYVFLPDSVTMFQRTTVLRNKYQHMSSVLKATRKLPCMLELENPQRSSGDLVLGSEQAFASLQSEVEVCTKPGSVSMSVSFKPRTLNNHWDVFLGPHLYQPYLSHHWANMVVRFHPQSYWKRCFLKATHFELSDDYMTSIRNTAGTILNGNDLMTCYCKMTRAKNTSFIHQTDGYKENMQVFHNRVLGISVDFEKRRAKQLDPEWKQRVLNENPGQSPISTDFPRFDPSLEFETLFMYDFKIHENCIDHNGHVNHKVYLFGGLVSLWQAVSDAEICDALFGRRVALDDVVIKAFTIHYEEEARLNDNIVFQLQKARETSKQEGNGSCRVIVMKGTNKLADCKLELALVSTVNLDKTSRL